jgi:hypothetical protein
MKSYGIIKRRIIILFLSLPLIGLPVLLFAESPDEEVSETVLKKGGGLFF